MSRLSVGRSRVLLGALAVGLGVMANAAPVSASSVATMFDVGIDDCTISGEIPDAPLRSKIKVEWRSADGTLRLRETVHATFGYWGTDISDDCFEYGAGVQPGDVITATVKGVSRTFTVPPLTVRVDRNTDRVTGVTKASGKLIVWVRGYDSYAERRIKAAADGTYVADFQKGTKLDILGFDRVDVAWTNGRGDYVRNWNMAPGVRVGIDRPWVVFAGQSGFNATFKLRQAPGGPVVAKAVGTVYAGTNEFLWLDRNGNEVAVHEGNQVATDVAADATFVVPTIGIGVNKKTDKVTVDTGLGAGLHIQMQVTGPGNGSWANGQTNADGRYVVDFSDDPDVQLYDIVSGTRIVVTVRLATGDEVVKNYYVG